MAGSIGLAAISAGIANLASISPDVVFAKTRASAISTFFAHAIMLANSGALTVPASVLGSGMLTDFGAAALLAPRAPPIVLANLTFVTAIEPVIHCI